MSFSPELEIEALEESFLSLIEKYPLDDVIEALAGAFRRHEDSLHLNVAIELWNLRGRDYTPSDEEDLDQMLLAVTEEEEEEGREEIHAAHADLPKAA